MAVTEAKAEFSALVEQAIHGDEVILTKHGKPVAKIVKYQKPKMVFGLLAEKYPELADIDLDDNSHMAEAWARWRENLEDLGK